MDRKIPIPVLHLFPVLDELLIDLLRSLSADDWNKPTLARQWSVKDIAAHLLDVSMRAISSKEGYTPPLSSPVINGYQDLVTYLNELNAVWVYAMKRVSPSQIIKMLEDAGKPYNEYLSSIDPFGPAKYSVAWAGEDESTNWFHIAREYTEKWHHQQQIRNAIGKTAPLMTKELFYPCIDIFMRGLPHAFRNVAADNGYCVQITISGEAGGNWYLSKTVNGWALDKTSPNNAPVASVVIPPDVAWKVFTKGISSTIAIDGSTISGDVELGEKVFSLIAVMA